MKHTVNEDKWVVVSGETSSNRIFAGVLGGSSVSKDERVFEDENQRKELDVIARKGGSILIVGGADSGKTTLLTRLVRNNLESSDGFIVLDSATKEYVEAAIAEVKDKGWKVETNTSVLATVIGIDVSKGFDEFTEYWKSGGMEEVTFDVVVYIANSEIREIYKPVDYVSGSGIAGYIKG